MRGGVRRCRWVAASGAALLAIGAIIAAFTWQKIFDSVLVGQLALQPGSRSYQQWVSPSVPIYFDIHLFNWTNAEKFPEEKPNFQELGPYRFREIRRRVNITWNQHNSSVGYRTYRAYYFDAAYSNGSLDDNIVCLNPLAASAAYRSRNEGDSKQNMIAMSLAAFGQHLSVSKLAGELMFDGYKDLLLDIAMTLPDSATGGAPKIDKFGWFYGRNDSIDSEGYVEVSTGADHNLPGQILLWNHKDHLPFYDGECAKLEGSLGEFLPRNMTEESVLTMFVTDLCRPVHMYYAFSGDVDGLQYHRYALNEDSFDNGPSNECFCEGACDWVGVMNVSACRYGAPSLITQPHFYQADKRIQDAVTGLHPDPEKHSFYFAVEPKLGIPVDVAARFQLNLYIEPNSHYAMYRKVPKMLFPMLWVEQHVQVDSEILKELKFVRGILDWGAIFCAGVAIFLAAIVAFVTYTNICHSDPKYKPPSDLIYEKPKDEAEMKLNPM